MNMDSETEVDNQSLRQRQRGQLGHGVEANERRKHKTNKTSVRTRRTAQKTRKRNREGQLASGSHNSDTTDLHQVNDTDSVVTSEIGSSISVTSNDNPSGDVEIIDVEQFRDLPLVDLTRDSRNDVYVDLTRDLPNSPERPTSTLSARRSVIWLSPHGEGSSSQSLQDSNKNRDDVTVVNNSFKRVVNDPEPVESSITCAICMDSYDQIKKGRRQLTSTTCGHVFCSTCIASAISTQSKCPTCRKKLTRKQLHPLFL